MTFLSRPESYSWLKLDMFGRAPKTKFLKNKIQTCKLHMTHRIPNLNLKVGSKLVN
jgi:hypothetical protein